ALDRSSGPPLHEAVAVVALNASALAALVLIGPAGSLAVVTMAVAAPLLGALLRRPQRGLLVLAALVPFDGLLLIIGHPGPAEGWKEALVLLTLGATVVAPASARAVPGGRRPVWAPATAALVGLAVLSSLTAGLVQGAVGLKVGFFYVLLGVAAWRCPLDARERDRLVTILMGVGLVTALVGLAQQVVGPARLFELGYEYNETIRYAGGQLRSFSTFNQPFPFAFFLVLVLLVGVPVALSEPARLRSRLFLLSLPLFALALVSTVVRGAWLALAVGGAFLAARRHRALFLLVPPALVLLAYLPKDLASPAFSSDSAAERATSWRANLDRIVDNPLGVGVGASGAAAEKAASGTGRETYQPDNYYVKTVLELGLVGLWLFALVLAGGFSAARSVAARVGGPDGALALGVAASLVAAAAACMASTYLEIFPLDLYFWLLLAVVARCDTGSP
ncbi:MAG: O-antigen ligase family protein, partial [Acidimicrobiales bacterium]